VTQIEHLHKIGFVVVDVISGVMSTTVKLLEKEMPEFIPPQLWPPNSPYLNPVDYSMWGTLQQKVYETRIADLDDHKHRLRTEWSKLDHAIIAAAIQQWRRRLSACVTAGGGHDFKHCF